MEIVITPNWSDYELLDSGNERRFERFGKYLLVRPDPQAIWQPMLSQEEWDKADAIFQRSTDDKGTWRKQTELPEKWLMQYNDLSFYAKLTPFKHTGVFPEQASQWDFIASVIATQSEAKGKQSEEIATSQAPRNDTTFEPNILNLFGYTGIATLAAAHAGAKVTHVDASKSAITWARENQIASGLEQAPIRWILDDALKFVEREVKRGTKYDGIIMDPPIYGHGPNGELWKFSEHFPKLVELCKQVLSPTPLFVIINAYAISSSAIMLANVLGDYTKELSGSITYGELALQEQSSKRLLSTGIFTRWQNNRTIEQ